MTGIHHIMSIIGMAVFIKLLSSCMHEVVSVSLERSQNTIFLFTHALHN